MSMPPKIDDFSKNEIKNELDNIRFPFEIAIYSSENYFNMGAIFRVGHNFLCRMHWMVDFDTFYKKASMGTHKWENVRKCTLSEFVECNYNRNLVVFEKRPNLTTKNIQTYTYPDNPILFFGSEKYGVPQQILEYATDVVTIPLYGIHNDLNLVSAVSIAAYDFTTKLMAKSYVY